MMTPDKIHLPSLDGKFSSINLVNLIGHSTNSEALGIYMKQLGIKARPKATEALSFIKSKELFVSLTFQDYLCYLDDSLNPPVDEGPFILLDVTFHSSQLWQLPYGIEFYANSQSTEGKLGGPVKKAIKSSKKMVHHYVKGHLRVDVFYEDDVATEVRFSSLDKYDKMHGLA